MNDTSTLIARLTSEASSPVMARAPLYWVVRLLAVFILYGAAAQIILGLRGDIILQFTRPLFVAEIVLLLAVLLSSGLAAILAMYPDAFGKRWFLRLPYIPAAMLAVLMVVQFFLPADGLMQIPTAEADGLPCTVCIGLMTVFPSAVMFIVLSKGASVRPLQAGALAVLAASALGCLAIRLREPNDDLMHLITAHYLPTLLFAVVGACIGKRALRW